MPEKYCRFCFGLHTILKNVVLLIVSKHQALRTQTAPIGDKFHPVPHVSTINPKSKHIFANYSDVFSQLIRNKYADYQAYVDAHECLKLY